jgi:hypothetical protein
VHLAAAATAHSRLLKNGISQMRGADNCRNYIVFCDYKWNCLSAAAADCSHCSEHQLSIDSLFKASAKFIFLFDAAENNLILKTAAAAAVDMCNNNCANRESAAAASLDYTHSLALK